MERKYNATCPFCSHHFKIEYLEVNLICEECNFIIGYHEDSKLPKPGTFFVLPKGTSYHSMLKGNTFSKKQTKKKLHHMLNGVVNWHNGTVFENGHYLLRPCLLIEDNPKVRWVGSGGYWCSADINNVNFL